MKKLEMREMEMVEGGNKAIKAVGVGCAVAGIGITVLAGIFTFGFGAIVASSVAGGFCGGFSLAAALDS